MNIINTAKENLTAGLSVIPTQEGKKSILSWKPYQTKRMTEEEVDRLFTPANVIGLGIICGAISGGLEVIDVDTKHDTTGTLWDELSKLIQDNLPELYSSLVIAQTPSGGYHIYYRCSSIAGNLKLSNKNNKETLIETRGEGGYVIAPPTPGYTYIQGSPQDIASISPQDREILFSISRSFNELPEPVIAPKQTFTANYSTPGLSPWEDYNHRGDIIGLLESKGWRVVNETRQRINLLRPGQTDSKTSGNFHTGLRVLRVFSTSTEFNPDKGYSPSQVFTLLECNGDNKLTYRRLLELGYGEPYKGEDIRPTQVKIEQVRVEVVDRQTGETSVISTPGQTLKIENLQNAIGEEVVISSPGSEAEAEVLQSIDLIQQTGKRIYIQEGGSEVREYRYQLRAIFRKYATLQTDAGKLTDRQIDQLQDEVVILSFYLQPADKDILLQEFISHPAVKELGVKYESIDITRDRLTTTREREAQAQEFNNLLQEAQKLQQEGKTDKALELLDKRVKDVKLQDKATEFSSLLIPPTEEAIKKKLRDKPDSLSSGYSIKGEELFLPSGAISVFTAPTSHGKTTFLINLALNVSIAYPSKQFYFFSYEEDTESIIINTLNTYIDKAISGNNRTTLKNYFAGKNIYSMDYPSKESFFNELITTGRLNIHYSSYNSDTLIEAIRYLNKNANPGGIFIDYIQLLNLPEGKYKTYSRQEEIKEICIALKDVAVETGLPIILGAQFNREVVNQLRIHATKIGEAGDIERIANLIVGFWNNNFKPVGTEGEINEISAQGIATQGTIYATILKNRGGRVGLSELLDYNGNTGKIKNSVFTPTPSSESIL